MAGFLTRLAVIPAIVSFTIATKVTIGKDLTSPALPYLFGSLRYLLSAQDFTPQTTGSCTFLPVIDS